MAHNNKVRRNVINGENIYQSRNVGLNRNYTRNISSDRYKKSKYAMKTNIIPDLYNKEQGNEIHKFDSVINGMMKSSNIRQYNIEAFDNDSVFSDISTNKDTSCRSCDNNSIDLNNTMDFINKADKIKNNDRHTSKFLDNNQPGFLSQFEESRFDNPGDPVSSNNVHHKIGKNAYQTKIETERKLAINGGYSKFVKNNDMTYGIVNQENFVHHNMVPFFGKGYGKGYGPNSIMQKKLHSIRQRKVDEFTGSIKNIGYRPKVERRPLFNPHVGLTWIYGSPVFTDYYQTRYIPSKFRRNEKLHQPVRVTPGLNLPYNAISRHGFHDTWRALPKTTNETRTANNPKISYGNVIKVGKKGERRSIVGSVLKHRPETSFELDPRDLQKGRSYITAPRITGNFDISNTNRQQTTKAWAGPAKFAAETLHLPQSQYPKVKISHKENFKYDAPRNITGVDRSKNITSTVNTYYVPNTMRQTTQNRTYLPVPYHHQLHKGGYQPEQSGTHAPNTIRQTTQNKTYQQHAYNSQLHRGGYHAEHGGTYAPNTIRQTTQNKTYQQHAHPSQLHRGGYHAEHGGIHVPNTIRQTTQNKTYQQHAYPSQLQRGGYHAEHGGIHVPNTIRQTTQNKTYQQHAYPSQLQRGGYQAEQGGIHVPNTIRQTTQNKTYQQHAYHNQLHKGGYHAEQGGIHVPNTIRQTTQNKTYQQHAYHSQLHKGGYQAEHGGIHVPNTLRQTTQNKTYQQHAYHSQLHKGGYHAEHGGTYAPNTIRQTTQNRTYQQPAYHSQINKGGYQPAQDGTHAPNTIRQTTQNRTYQQPAYHSQINKGGYGPAQDGTHAPNTIRQTTQNRTYQQPAYNSQINKGGYQPEQSGTHAPNTMRQMTQNNTHLNAPILHEGKKQRRRKDAYNSLVNINKDNITIIRDGGAPTTSNYDKIPTFEHTMVQICEPIQSYRRVYGQMIGQRPLQCLPLMYTRGGRVLPQQSWHFNNYPEESLKTNWLINNISHKSVTY